MNRILSTVEALLSVVHQRPLLWVGLLLDPHRQCSSVISSKGLFMTATVKCPFYCTEISILLLTNNQVACMAKVDSSGRLVEGRPILAGCLFRASRFFAIALNDGYFQRWVDCVYWCIERTFVSVKKAWVYIITNRNKSVLYTGVTSDMPGRLQKHVDGHYKGFASKYGLPAGFAH